MALDAFEKGEKPDIILSDIMMPHMDGSTFYKMMCNQGVNKDRFLFMTGGAVTEDAMAFEKHMSERNSLVTKPFLKDELRKVIFNRINYLISLESNNRSSFIDCPNTNDDLTSLVVTELEILLGQDVLKEKYKKFDQQIDVFLIQAENLNENDLASLAHKVSGAAAMLGADNFAESLRILQKAASKKDESKVAEFLINARMVAVSLRHSISEYLNS
jgi:CheY-like chemotaxis protein